MDPGLLAQYLAVLREAGVTRAKVDPGGAFEVEFAPVEPPPSAPLVDENGNPVDLDEGMPDLARDPIEAANFPGAKK